jgi:hypothetical protein
LDDELRAAFAAQIRRLESRLPVTDPAGTAIRRARRIQRLRTGATSLAAVVLLVATLSGAISLRGWYLPDEQRHANLAQPATSAPAQLPTAAHIQAAVPDGSATLRTLAPSNLFPDSGPALDVWAGNELWTRTGERMRLTGAGEVRWVYHVPAGWVYGGEKQVRLLRPGGDSVPLTDVDNTAAPLAPADQKQAAKRADGTSAATSPRWVLSQDGTRIAYTAGGRLEVGTVSAGGLTVERSTFAAGAAPVLFYEDSVVLSTTGANGYGIWWPGQAYAGVANSGISYVYGAYGNMLLGSAPDPNDAKRSCLVLIEPTAGGLRPQPARGCGLGLASEGLASPDGRYLAQWDKDDVRLVEVASAINGTARTSDCPVSTKAVPTWESPGALVLADGGQAITCTVAGAVESFTPPDGVPDGWQFVPSLLDT